LSRLKRREDRRPDQESDEGAPMQYPIGEKKELRVVFLRLRSLGDTVLMTPALAAAKRLPNCKVGVVVETPFHEVLVHNPNVDRLFVLDRNRNNLSERIRSVAAIRSFAPHLAIDLHGGTTSAWMTFFSKAARRVGYAASRNAFLYNLRVPVSSEIWGKKQLHTVEHQLSPLKHLGYLYYQASCLKGGENWRSWALPSRLSWFIPLPLLIPSNGPPNILRLCAAT